MCTQLTDKEEKQETEMIEGSCWSLFQEPRRGETCPEALGCARAKTGQQLGILGTGLSMTCLYTQC